jgi:hypothetical protein
MIACQSSTWALKPNTAHNALSSNQAQDEFETGAYREKDPAGMWIIAVIGGIVLVGSAVLVPLYVNDKL